MSKCEHEVETRCVRPLRVSPKRAFFIRKMGENMSLKYITEILPALFSGAGMTLNIFFWTLILATPLGILVSLGEMSKIKPLKWVVNFYVWIMRGTPLLLQLIFVFYGLPMIHIVFPRYQAALFAFVTVPYKRLPLGATIQFLYIQSWFKTAATASPCFAVAVFNACCK